MSTRTVTATTVDRSLKLLRRPADLVIALLPGDRVGPAPAARVVVDRIDTIVRSGLATALGDQSLRADADRREAATDERQRALDLRREAERREQQTQERLQASHEEAGRRRQAAGAKASKRRESASESQRKRARNAAAAERVRKQVNREQELQAEERIATATAEAELPAVEEQARALQEREVAAREQAEAERLEQAAERVKAERKQEDDGEPI
jgi:hypothetical protein